MAQLNSTVIHGALNVTADISAGAIYSNGTQCLTGVTKAAVTGALGYSPLSGVSAAAVTTALGYSPLSGITKSDVTSALGYTPPTTNTTYTAATTTYAGLVKVGDNITINSSGIISPTKTGVTSALGYSPLSGVSAAAVTTALGYSPLSGVSAAAVTTALGYSPLSGVSASAVTTALGYTPPTTNTTYGNATTSAAGLMSTSAQTFAGAKTFKTGVSATSFTATSSRKVKKDISPSLISALDIIKDTEIVDFKYINDTENIPHVGFIAEDTPEILSTPKKTQMDMVNCIGVLMKAIQEITKGTEALEKRIKELENK